MERRRGLVDHARALALFARELFERPLLQDDDALLEAALVDTNDERVGQYSDHYPILCTLEALETFGE